MSTASSYAPAEVAGARSAIAARLADYLELTKPRIAVLGLSTVAMGYALGGRDGWSFAGLLNALVGIGLVAVSSSVLNQWAERRIDARMPRTADRPLPAGRMRPTEALVFGLIAGGLGCAYLAVCVNGLTSLLGLATLLLYTAVYTPLKRVTPLCTTVGAVPGALPPVLGWAASGGSLDAAAFALFAILFLWQFPHFLAIGWLYRDQYARAGLRMWPPFPASSRVNGFLSVAYASALLPVSLVPSQIGIAGNAYALAAMILGIGYLLSAVRFLVNQSDGAARWLVCSSLVYLPSLLVALVWDHFQLLT